MRRVIRASAGLLGVTLAAIAFASPASAADEVNIDHVEVKPGTVRMVVSADAIPGGMTPDPDSVEVAIDGRTVESTTKAVASGDIKRSTVLVLDASKSMRRDDRIDSAVNAISAFLDAAPTDVEIGLVTFADGVTGSIAPTTDHDALRTALSEVELNRETSVYDGIVEGVQLAGKDGYRSLLVLSDGADTSSTNSLDIAIGSATDAGVIVDVVSLANPARAQELSGLAEQTGGAVIPVDPAALGAVFAKQADSLAQQLLVSFDVPEDVADEASVSVSLDAGGTTYTDSTLVNMEASGTDLGVTVVDSGKALVGKPGMLLGALALLIGLGGVLAVILVGASDNRSAATKRLDSYFDAGQTGGGRRRDKSRAASTDLRGSAVAMADKVVSKDLETRISQRLTGAGSSLNAPEWVLLHAAIAVLSGLAGMIFGGVLLGFLGFIAGVVVPWVYLRFRHKRRLARFNGQLAQTLGLMAGGLQAGLSLPQAVDSVVREGQEPMAGEMRRALVEQRLGIDITDALESIGERMDSNDFGWVVMAIRIQREVGGNLAEILNTVADTIREREYLRRQVRALSAEGRLSGYILTGLPILVFVYMLMGNGDYVRVLYTTFPGYVMLFMATVLLGLGSFAMMKLATVEV
jgi:tight adherence protein B